MPTTDTQGLLLRELGDIYDAEHRFLEGQQEIVQEATDQELEKAIREHIEQTRLHIRNLEQVFEQLGWQPQRQTSEVAQGLVSKAQRDIQEAQDDALRNCAINAAVVRIEHFEVSSCRNLVTGPRQMLQSEVVDLLQQNLQQQEETARIAEPSAPELLQKARQAEEESLIDKAKDKLQGR